MSHSGSNGSKYPPGETIELSPVVVGAIDFLAGTAGGTANVLVGQPLDTIKVKMQTFPHLYPNTWDCFRQTLTKVNMDVYVYYGCNNEIVFQNRMAFVMDCMLDRCLLSRPTLPRTLCSFVPMDFVKV